MKFEEVYARFQDAFALELLSINPDAPDRGLAGALRVLNRTAPACSFHLKNGSIERTSYTPDDKALLEEVVRAYALHIVRQATSAQQPLMVYALQGQSVPVMPRLFHVLYTLSETPLVDQSGNAPGGGLPVNVLDTLSYCRVIEECLEVATVPDANAMFTYLEQTGLAEVLARDPRENNSSKYCILRALNGLLKRLSKAQDLQVCGRILIFIARIYALADKSGINLHGTANTSLTLRVDEVERDAVDSSGEPIDAKLYATFWSLQNVFKQPGQMYTQSVFTKVLGDMNYILDELQTRKVIVKAGLSASSAQSGPQGSQDELMTARYLSSSKLFGLQLRDATFRRQFLVQCALLLNSLRAPSKQDKDKADRLESAAGRVAEAEAALERIYAAISDTPDDGKEFAASVRHVLSRERNWVDWKNQGCPPFERSAADTPALEAPKASEESAIVPRPAGPVKRRRIDGDPAAVKRRAATTTLLRLSSVPSHQLSGLKASERRFNNMPLLPSFSEFVAPVLEDLDPENAIESDYTRIRQDPVYAWKVLRMMSRTHFEKMDSIKGSDTVKETEQAVLKCYPELEAKFKAQQEARAAELKAFQEQEAAEAAAAQAAAQAAPIEAAP